jgi:hypothetical protein
MADQEKTATDEPPRPRAASKPYRLKLAQRITAILASVAVIAGVCIALIQLHQTESLERQRSLQAEAAEKRRLAIEAISQARSVEFLRAYRRLTEVYLNRHNKPPSADRPEEREERMALIDSLNYVMNVYDSIAIIYNHDLADRCIIKENIYDGSRQMARFCDAFQYQANYRKNFDAMLALMETQKCAPNNP